jgi:hypothetical protein
VRIALAVLVLVFVSAAGAAIPRGPDPIPVDPYSALLVQFQRQPLVAFLETHGSAAQHRFLRSLVARPEFGKTVDAVVVEFGSARYQVTIDRYVRGERVPLSSLSRVWMRTTQTSGVWNDPVYRDFFRAVRAANAGRPPGERIRVLLGDPPIDWHRIRSSTCPRRQRPSCLEYWIARRGQHYASVVLDKVLARGQRALLIAGAFHLIRPPAGHAWNETGILERRQPGSVFAVKPHDGFGGNDWEELERRVRRWPVPSLALVRGTWLGALDASLAFSTGQTLCARPGEPLRPCPNPLLAGRLEERIDAYLVLGLPA